ncbi:serine hydrolase [Candidatus Pelagibacter sp.]|nr:serine hydrolase [Candidatus Pelagibacter sp.]
MKKKKLVSVRNPELTTLKDNKASWNLPKTRRFGYKNLYKINRYSIFLRSDLILKLNSNPNKTIAKLPLVKKMTKNKSFCSLIVGNRQNILFEKYAKDFKKNQPQTIMSITKMFVNLFIGELVTNKLIDLNKKVSHYLPKIGSGYANAKIQDVLNMNVINSYTEDYTKAYSSSFMHEPVGGWRLPKNLKNHLSQEEYLNTIKKSKNKSLINNSEYAFYKSANTDVVGLIIEKVSGKTLRDWVLSVVEAAGFEDGLYIASDRYGMPWMSGGGCLITRDFLRMGLLFARKGMGVGNRKIGSSSFLNKTINNVGPKYMNLSKDKYLYYSNSTMVSGNMIGHSGYGGQFLATNFKTGNVAAFFSVLETKSATKESYKTDMINMLIDLVNKKY